MDVQAVALSLKLAVLTAALLLPVGLPLAWALARGRFPGRSLLEAVVATPLVLPPTVLGYYLLLAFSPQRIPGRWYEALTGHGLAFSFEGLVAASLVHSLPFMVQPMAAAFAALPRRYLEASWCLGASPLRTFARVALPLCWPGLAAGLMLAFAHTVGEFGVVVMVGGNLPGVTRTASVAIYDAVQAMDYATAGRTSLFLLALSLAVLWTTSALRRRAGGPWPP